MPGVIIKGKEEQVPGLTIANWNDNPVLRLNSGDCRPRTTGWVRGIVLHTTKGEPSLLTDPPQVIMPGLGPNTGACTATTKFWAADSKHAGAHFIVDFDGSMACCADLVDEAAFHASLVNDVTIGVEIFQGHNRELYDGQLDAVVLLVDWLTKRFGIQRQVQDQYHNCAIPRLAQGAKDVVGVYGHRDCSDNRGTGDPGDAIFNKLFAAGYEKVNFAKDEDKALWLPRQQQLGIVNPDGVPGPRTTAVIKTWDATRTCGLWIRRPIDTK